MTDRKPFLEMPTICNCNYPAACSCGADARGLLELCKKYEAKIASDAETIAELRRESDFRRSVTLELREKYEKKVSALESELAARRASDEDVRMIASPMKLLPGVSVLELIEASERLLAQPWLKKGGG